MKYHFDFRQNSEHDANGNKSKKLEIWLKVNDLVNKDQDWAYNLLDDTLPSENDTKKFARKTLRLFYELIDKEIQFFLIEKDKELEEVLEIFVRVNTGGTKLTYSNLLESRIIKEWGKDGEARQKIEDLVEDINKNVGQKYNNVEFDIDDDLVLKAMLVLSDNNPSFSTFAKSDSKKAIEKIQDKWDVIKDSLTDAFKLIASFGFSKGSLTSNNAAIPIAYYLMCRRNKKKTFKPDNDDRSSIKKWLCLSLLNGVFGGQPDSLLKNLRDIIKSNGDKNFPLVEISKNSSGKKSLEIRKGDIEKFMNLEYGDPKIRAILMLVCNLKGKYYDYIDVDHIYPKAKFTKDFLQSKGVPENQIKNCIKLSNTLPNLQLLPSSVNRGEKSKVDFEDWLNNYHSHDKNEFLEQQCIPQYEHYPYSEFTNFIEERKEMLKKPLEEIVGVTASAPSESDEDEIDDGQE